MEWRGGGEDTPNTQTTTHTATGDGAVKNVSVNGAKWFGLRVKGTGAAATTWVVNLRTSLTGAVGSYTDGITHANTTDGDGDQLTNSTPIVANYFYVEVASLTLGSATNISVTVTAMN